jgi:hypothetical protein
MIINLQFIKYLFFVVIKLSVAYVACAGIFKRCMGARNRVGIGSSFRPVRPHMLEELIPWNRFLGSLKV